MVKLRLNKKIIVSIALIFLILGIFVNNVYAANMIDSDKYDPEPSINMRGSFVGKVRTVLGWIRLAGIGVALIAITIIGVKYIFISVEEKAEYKKAMLPYLIGFFMLLCVSVVIEIIASIAEG